MVLCIGTPPPKYGYPTGVPKQARLSPVKSKRNGDAMKSIGLDLDGTISEAPQFFALLSAVLKAAGHQVHIITYRDPSPQSIEETKQELADWKISYDALHIPSDDFGMGMGEWKRSVAEKLSPSLDLMFDDSLEVLSLMPKGILRMWVLPEDVLRD